MNFGKKRFFALTLVVALLFGILGFVPGMGQNAQAAVDSSDSPTVVEQKLREYMNANPPGGAAYNCMTFAKGVFAYIFGYEATSIDYHGNYDDNCSMDITARLGNTACGGFYGTTSGDVSAAAVKSIMLNANPGDIIQVMTGGHGKHTMVFVSANDNGVTVYHGNWNGKIAVHTFSYEEFAGRWSHSVTIYHAVNYDYVNNPINATPIESNLEVEGMDEVTPKVYEIYGENYYSLRDIAYMVKDTPFKFDFATDEGLTLLPGRDLELNETEMAPADGERKFAEKGEGQIKMGEETFESDYYVIDENVYIPIREVADIIGFSVEWNSEKECAEISLVKDIIEETVNVEASFFKMDSMITFN